MKKINFVIIAFLFSLKFYAQEISSDSLLTGNYSLKEVVIFGANRQYVKVTPEKTTIDVKNNPLLNSGTSMDAVKRVPGVITNPLNGLLLNGKEVTIYIDGSPSAFSGVDLQNYLATLPATAIDKIELISNPGASFEAGSSGTVINILTNSKRKKGINASLNLNYGFNKYQKPSPQLVLNGRENDWSWQTLLGYSYAESEVFMANDQTFTASMPQVKLKQTNLIAMTNSNFYFRVGTGYKLTPKSDLLFNYNGVFTNDRDKFDMSTTGNGIDYRNKGGSKKVNNNHEISLQFKTRLDTLGSNLSIVAFRNIFNKEMNTNAIDNREVLNNGLGNFKLNNNYIKFDFEIPSRQYDFFIHTGGKYNSIQVDNLGVFNTNNALETINFDYRESNFAFYTSVAKKIKKLTLTGGVRFEDFSINRIASTLSTPIRFRNTNFFPNVNAAYDFNENMNASVSYSRKINQPSYYSLDPNNSAGFDQYNQSQGNPFLNPTFNDNYEFKVAAFELVSLGVNYTQSKGSNQIVFNAPSDGQIVSRQTFQQFEEFNTWSAAVSFPIVLDWFFKSNGEENNGRLDLSKVNHIFFNVNYSKSEIKGFQFPFENKAIINCSAQAQMQLPGQIKGTAGYSILTKGTWQIYEISKPVQQFDLAFSKNFWNNNIKVGLSVTDSFNTNNVNAVIAGQHLNTNFYKKEDSRAFRVSLTYNFGNLKLSNVSTKIENEKIELDTGLIK